MAQKSDGAYPTTAPPFSAGPERDRHPLVLTRVRALACLGIGCGIGSGTLSAEPASRLVAHYTLMPHQVAPVRA